MAEHHELVAEMALLERMSTQDRLKLARKRRIQQLKKYNQKEKEFGSKKNKKNTDTTCALSTSTSAGVKSTKRGKKCDYKVHFVPSVMLLESAARNDIDEVRRLLMLGVNPDSTNEDGLTALHQCCIDDSEEMMKLLIEFGANVNARDTENWTPLHAAATCGHLHLAKYLIEKDADLLAVNSEGNMPYDICEDDATLDYIESEMAKRGITQEIIDETRAVTENQMLNDLKYLADTGQDLEWRDSVGATPLHIAAANGYLSVVEFLLDQHVSTDVADDDLWQPVHSAACWGHPDVLEALVQAGADLQARTKNGETPLDICEDPELKERIIQLKSEIETKRASTSHKLKRSHSSNTRSQSVRRTSIREKSQISRREAREEGRMRQEKESSLARTTDEEEDVNNANGGAGTLPRANNNTNANSGNSTSQTANSTPTNDKSSLVSPSTPQLSSSLDPSKQGHKSENHVIDLKSIQLILADAKEGDVNPSIPDRVNSLPKLESSSVHPFAPGDLSVASSSSPTYAVINKSTNINSTANAYNASSTTVDANVTNANYSPRVGVDNNNENSTCSTSSSSQPIVVKNEILSNGHSSALNSRSDSCMEMKIRSREDTSTTSMPNHNNIHSSSKNSINNINNNNNNSNNVNHNNSSHVVSRQSSRESVKVEIHVTVNANNNNNNNNINNINNNTSNVNAASAAFASGTLADLKKLRSDQRKGSERTLNVVPTTPPSCISDHNNSTATTTTTTTAHDGPNVTTTTSGSNNNLACNSFILDSTTVSSSACPGALPPSPSNTLKRFRGDPSEVVGGGDASKQGCCTIS